MAQPRRRRKPQQPKQQQPSPQAKAAVALGAGAGIAAAGHGPLPPPPPASAIAKAAGAILDKLSFYFEFSRRSNRTFLQQSLNGRGVAPDDVGRLIDEEMQREQTFTEKQRARTRRDVQAALSIPDPLKRERAVRGVVGTERHYSRLRARAMAARSIAATDRVVLRADSPQGAFWKLDPTVIEHTAGCLILGGKFWPWVVLDRVHPPRHAGCPCRLISYGEAIATGLMAADSVRPEPDAIRAAAGVVMEAERAAELAQLADDYELAEEMVRRGLADDDALVALGFPAGVT